MSLVKASQPAVNFDLNIERIVLDGVALSHAEQQQMAQALQTELGRLLGTGQVNLVGASSVPKILAAPLALGTMANGNVHAQQLGQQIAQSVHQSLMLHAAGKP